MSEIVYERLHNTPQLTLQDKMMMMYVQIFVHCESKLNSGYILSKFFLEDTGMDSDIEKSFEGVKFKRLNTMGNGCNNFYSY